MIVDKNIVAERDKPKEQSLRRRTTCRLCFSPQLELALSIKATPVGDAYVSQERLSEPQDLYPLDVYLCKQCGHAQHLDVVDPTILFRNYTYKTVSSSGLVE